MNKPPMPQPTANNNANSTYMPLDLNSMDSPGQSTYEGIGPRNPAPAVNGNGTETYMGIDPRTRNPTSGSQYMDLKEARSN